MAQKQKPVKATADIKKNRLYMTIAGNIDANKLQKLYTDIRFCVADLKEGFEVVSDVSQCNILYVTGMTIYKKIFDFLIDNQVGSIVQIINDDNISYKQLANYFRTISDDNLSYKQLPSRTLYTYTLEEAEQKLDELAERGNIHFSLNSMQIQYERNGQIETGQVIDISVSNCAIRPQGAVPLVGEEIGLHLAFTQGDDKPAELFELRAKVVPGGEAGQFAAQFFDLDQKRREQFYQHLASEAAKTSLESP